MFAHVGNDMEWSLDVQAESSIELSLLWRSLPGINVEDVPLEVDLVLFVVQAKIAVLFILAGGDFDSLSFLVDKVSTLISKELEPS